MSKNIEKISDIFDADKVTNSRIEIFGQKRIEIEGCYGIKEYSEDITQINMPNGILIIMGSNLQILILGNRNIILEGSIISIQFEGSVI